MYNTDLIMVCHVLENLLPVRRLETLIDKATTISRRGLHMFDLYFGLIYFSTL